MYGGERKPLSPFQSAIDSIVTFGKVRLLHWETDEQMAEAGTRPLTLVKYQTRANGAEVAKLLTPLAQKMYLNHHSLDLLSAEKGFKVSKRIEVNKDWQYPRIFYLEMKDQDADQRPHGDRLVFNLDPKQGLKFKRVERWFMGGIIRGKEIPSGWYDSTGSLALFQTKDAQAEIRRLESKINEIVAALV
jgi:hypothetical protein